MIAFTFNRRYDNYTYASSEFDADLESGVLSDDNNEDNEEASSYPNADKNSSNDSGCILLLDEPTAACDNETTLLVERALIMSGCAIIMTTHDDRQAIRLAHKRFMLSTVNKTIEVELDNV